MNPEEVADFVADRARRDPGVQRLVDNLKLFDGLREHAGWRRLYERVNEERQTFMASLAKRLMRGEIVSQREIDYTRGFHEGAAWIISQPEEADKHLEAAARRAWTMVELELLRERKDDSPYA